MKRQGGTGTALRKQLAYARVHYRTVTRGLRSFVRWRISTDIAALVYLAALGERLFPRLRALDLPVVVRELATTLNRETDFSREARSIVLFRTALADVPGLWIAQAVEEQ